MAAGGWGEGDRARHFATPGPSTTWRAPGAVGGAASSTRTDPRQVVVTPTGERGEWVIEAETPVYLGGWVEVATARVRSPIGREHSREIIRARSEDVGAVVVDSADRVLLLWRHRFVTGSWGLELPTGCLRKGEDAGEAAVREVVEKAGWSTSGDAHRVWTGARGPDHSDLVGHVVWLRASERVGSPDPEVAAHLHWLDRAQVRDALAEGRVNDVFTLAALLWWLATDGGATPLVTARPDDPRGRRS